METSTGIKNDAEMLMRANVNLLQVYVKLGQTTKGDLRNYKDCISILEETVKIFEKLICKFGVAMCSVLLAHPTLCTIKTLTIKGVSSIEYLKI